MNFLPQFLLGKRYAYKFDFAGLAVSNRFGLRLIIWLKKMFLIEFSGGNTTASNRCLIQVSKWFIHVTISWSKTQFLHVSASQHGFVVGWVLHCFSVGKHFKFPSINKHFPPHPSRPSLPEWKLKSRICKSIKIKFSNQFPIVIRLSVLWCLAQASLIGAR